MAEAKKSIYNHWIFKGIVLAIITVIIEKGFDLRILTGLKHIILDFWGLLSEPYSLPLWGWLLIALIGYGLICLVLILNAHTATPDPGHPKFYEFQSFVINDVLYRWQWKLNPDGWETINLQALCNLDKCILLLDSSYAAAQSNYCPICSKSFKVKTEQEIQVLIRHRIDNNLYQPGV